MTKKSKALSEEDMVTPASKKGGKGKKIAEEVLPTETDKIEHSSSDPQDQVSEQVNEQAVKDDSNPVSVEKIAELDEESSEGEGQVDEEEHEAIDLSVLSKIELLDLLKEKLGHGVSPKLDKLVQQIKSAFDGLTQKEREDALQQFLVEGGIEDDFSYRGAEYDHEFNSLVANFRSQLFALRKETERQKEKNLIAKTELLNKLRELVDGEETTLSMSAVKSIQETWKAIGPVPIAQNKNLWASFNALMDRFYDNRSIYFELKELDRKKNLEGKLELCEKAEALSAISDLKEAIRQLNELHEEFKHLGPVPREEQEQLWQRFKAASDIIYDRRKEFFDGQKEEAQKNLLEKETIIAI